MYYRMITSDYLAQPTETLLQGKHYQYQCIWYRDRPAVNLRVYNVSAARIVTLELIYSELILYSIAVDDAVLQRVIGW
jgi:hypothetical protein